MNEVIRRLSLDEIPDFVDIALNAYPGRVVPGPEFKERQIGRLAHIQESIPNVDYYGLFRDGKLIAGMRLHEYELNLCGQLLRAGGVGHIAVDLLHKKEKAAKALMQFFTRYFRDRGVPLLMLYPFRPDFYRKMGFGYGTKTNQYRILPGSFPQTAFKRGLVQLDASNVDAIRECSDRHALVTHGMMLKTPYELETLLQSPVVKLVGYMEDGVLKGYLAFSLKSASPDNFLLNDLIIHELVHETTEAMAQLGNFLHTQNDQINRVIWTTQDDAVEHWIGDPRNGSDRILPSVFHETHTSGVGLMYKITDIPAFIQTFGEASAGFSSEPAKLHFRVHDTFTSPEPLVFSLEYDQKRLIYSAGRASARLAPDDVLDMDISDFSSLFLGAVEAEKLYRYGKIRCTNTVSLSVLKSWLAHLPKPICTTAF